MKKKEQKIQIVLLFTGFILIVATYFYYPSIKEAKLKKNQPVIIEKEENFSEERRTTFENVEYQGYYDFDKPFTVESETAFIMSKENPDILYMLNMEANLHLSDGRIVRIVSNKGRYNKLTNDCFFEEDVKATDGETLIYADNLDLLATKNYVQIYNNVSLNHASGHLRADKVDYNFDTKNFKVSMLDEKRIKMKVIK